MDSKYNLSPMGTNNTKCYSMNGILMLPHYQIDGQFVGPGLRDGAHLRGKNNQTYSETQLVDAGAVPVFNQLWDRGGVAT